MNSVADIWGKSNKMAIWSWVLSLKTNFLDLPLGHSIPMKTPPQIHPVNTGKNPRNGTSNKELLRKLRSTNQRGELGMKVIPTWELLGVRCPGRYDG